ncbi:Ca-activated chloride channel family protein [Octadecabacter temperatus]|uniref:von Willebrand factor type A domain protein n=1 Tax=Octadecabacter temperatus TaxID=1458307 RepID=A0A0K0Y837_9RHOB|nr:VWA domain-containing protein [Octadecabacter temperatus]AKS47027.1 von Willebrand factor type A domain protein [Octadecabacter temperatus]SIO25445.1 Ca-activated chloride channel family protein [Octadecabacter temperatus]
MRIAAPLIVSLFTATPLFSQTTNNDVMVVFDMSGSMWGQVDGVAKVEIARNAFDGLLGDWEATGTRTGLIVYGHRERGNCADIETLSTPGDGSNASELLAGLSPIGKTPLSDAVRQAAEILRYTEDAATVVLLSDGVETCNADPCAVGTELEALGLDFTTHVIGFDIAEGDKAQLQCLADATGGLYFDAADAGELADAMDGVVQVTNAPQPVVDSAQDYQEVTIRVRMDGSLLAMPEQVTIYGNDVELGTLTDDTVVIPGLPLQLDFGPVTLRVEGDGISGERIVEITDQTEFIDLQVSGVQADYVIWRDGQLPILDAGKEHIVLLNNTTGIDRSSFYRAFIYPAGSTDPADAIRAGSVSPNANVYTAVRVPSPETPGDFELVATATDGTEYARIPISFAATIDPVWQGAREVKVGEVFDAYWAGSSNRRDGFQFMQAGQRVSRTTVEGMATDYGFQLTAPDEAGLYDLVFSSDFENSLGSKTTALGQIAVGMPLPQDGAIGFDTEDMSTEADAMGGEEFPLLDIGELHGDWQLVMQNSQRTIPLISFQLNHAEGEPTGTGGLVVEADPSWGFGPKGGLGDATLMLNGGLGLSMTIAVHGASTDYAMTPEGAGWTTEISTEDGGTANVLLIKAGDLAAADTARDATPVDQQLIAVDERNERLQNPVTWTLQFLDSEVPAVMAVSSGYLLDDFGRTPGNYQVTAQSGTLHGVSNIQLGTGHPRANVVVLKPETEGEDLALDVAFFCSVGEHCEMTMSDVPVDFYLPEGWGAERPIEIERDMPMFNMTTNTSSGPFFVTLNQPQRMADLGPCTELVTGMFCHDTTDDPALLADIALIQSSLSFKPVGIWLNEERLDTLLNQLTGDAQ